MLEIVALIFGTRHLAKVARGKGHSGWMAALFPVLWIVFELVGIGVGIVVMDGEQLGGICVGYMAALVGAGIAFAVIYALPQRELDYGDDPFGGSASVDDVNDNVWSG